MFLDLFGQECKKISKNILYYALIIIMILFYATQYATDSSEDISLMIREPREAMLIMVIDMQRFLSR